MLSKWELDQIAHIEGPATRAAVQLDGTVGVALIDSGAVIGFIPAPDVDQAIERLRAEGFPHLADLVLLASARMPEVAAYYKALSQ